MTDPKSKATPASRPGAGQRLRNLLDDYVPQGGPLKAMLVALVVYLVVVLVLGILWSAAPEPFDVNARVTQYISAGDEDPPTGAVTTAALIGVVETLLEKRGGFLYNDKFPPGVYLDNMPSWEYGVLIQARDLGRAMREVLSRSQSQSKEDPDLAIGEPRLNFQTDSCSPIRMIPMRSSTPAPTICATTCQWSIRGWAVCPSGSAPVSGSAGSTRIWRATRGHCSLRLQTRKRM